MSDEFGYLAAAYAGLRLYETASRGAGRTQRVLERATDKDCIITTTEAHAHRLRQELRALKKQTRVHSCPADQNPRDYCPALNAIRGRILFDHVWVLAYVEDRLQRADRTFRFLISKDFIPSEADLPAISRSWLTRGF